MGRDLIVLSEEEAERFWGQRVFLTATPGNRSYSLTTWAAYWAGGVGPQDTGKPTTV